MCFYTNIKLIFIFYNIFTNLNCMFPINRKYWISKIKLFTPSFFGIQTFAQQVFLDFLTLTFYLEKVGKYNNENTNKDSL